MHIRDGTLNWFNGQLHFGIDHSRFSLGDLNDGRAFGAATARYLAALAPTITIVQENCKPAADEKQSENHGGQYEKPEPVDIPGTRIRRYRV